MSSFTLIFLGMVIASMSSLVAALGWACWYTREKRPETTVIQAVRPPASDHRRAA